MRKMSVVASMILCAFTLSAAAGTTTPPKTTKRNTNPPKTQPVDNTTYQVIQITDMTGTVSFLVIDSTKYQAKFDELNKAYQEALKAWTTERDEFAKSSPGKRFEKPYPRTPGLKILVMAEKDKAKAEAAAKAYEEAYKRALGDPTTKPDGTKAG